MIKILNTSQIREADQYTIKNEPIASIDLMERASEVFVERFLTINFNKKPVKIFCGVGNNGGDGLAIGRLLKEKGWDVLIYIIGNPRNGSEDFKANLERSVLYAVLSSEADLPEISENDIVLDGLFGSGLTRPVEGLYADVIDFLNQQDCLKISIDIASGLFADQALSKDSMVFKPDITLTFQLPKLVFFLPESHEFVGEWHVLDIGLKRSFIEKQKTRFHLTEQQDVASLMPFRSSFTHKNQVGRLMLVAGSKGKMGAAVLSASAAFRSGAGLVNVCAPKCGIDILQISIPEAMVIDGKGANEVHKIPSTGDTVALGPGLDTKPKTMDALAALLHSEKQPMVIDADGLNILSRKKSLIKKIPNESILTPHPGEFKRLVGAWKNDFEKLDKLSSFCNTHHLNVVLKGAYSAVCNSSGDVYFNPTGNPGMAIAGSGDVLTGVVGALLSQGLAPFDALKLGVFVHGLAGDLAVEEIGPINILASDLIDFLPMSMSYLKDIEL